MKMPTMHFKEHIVSVLIQFIIDYDDRSEKELAIGFRTLEAELRKMAKYYIMHKIYDASEVERILDEMKTEVSGGLARFPEKTKQKFMPELQRIFLRVKNWSHLMRYWS